MPYQGAAPCKGHLSVQGEPPCRDDNGGVVGARSNDRGGEAGRKWGCNALLPWVVATHPAGSHRDGSVEVGRRDGPGTGGIGLGNTGTCDVGGSVAGVVSADRGKVVSSGVGEAPLVGHTGPICEEAAVRTDPYGNKR